VQVGCKGSILIRINLWVRIGRISGRTKDLIGSTVKIINKIGIKIKVSAKVVTRINNMRITGIMVIAIIANQSGNA
jgi:hypothetical protein